MAWVFVFLSKIFKCFILCISVHMGEVRGQLWGSCYQGWNSGHWACLTEPSCWAHVFFLDRGRGVVRTVVGWKGWKHTEVWEGMALVSRGYSSYQMD